MVLLSGSLNHAARPSGGVRTWWTILKSPNSTTVELQPAPDELVHVGGHVRAQKRTCVWAASWARRPVDEVRRAVPSLEQEMVSGYRVRLISAI
jgi:hypothetical protein